MTRSARPQVKKALGKPALWVSGVVLAAIAMFFQENIEVLFNSLLPEGWSEAGPAFVVSDVSTENPITGAFVPDPGSSLDQLSSAEARATISDPEWQESHEWYAVNRGKWEISLIGRRAHDVVISDMRPRLVRPCGELKTDGTLIYADGTGGDSKLELVTKVDAPSPVFQVPDEGVWKPYFDSSTIVLPRGETNILVMTATTSGPTCEWVVDVDFHSDGSKDTMTITAPDGDPFRITGMGPASAYDSFWPSQCRQPLTPQAAARYESARACE